MLTVGKSLTRVHDQTLPEINERISERTRVSIAYYAANPDHISERLHELDREWDVERWLQMNSATLSLFGLLLGATRSRAWLLLPIAVQSFFLQHGIQGWCPPLPVLRRLGVRSMEEIELERHALKALRGDFQKASENDWAEALHAAAADGSSAQALQAAEKKAVTTTERVSVHTPSELNARIRRQSEERLAFYAVHPELREKRLAEMEQEWDIERVLEVEAPSVSLITTVFGFLGSKKWLMVPLFAQTMMLAHAIQGFYPLLPLLRRMGFRTEDEIATERYAIKALRGDFRDIRAENLREKWSESAEQAFEMSRPSH